MLIGIRNQICFVAEITFFQGRFTAQRNGLQVAASLKHRISNAGDTIWNRDAGQACATPKRRTSNAGDIV